jgi:hypothetical protein
MAAHGSTIGATVPAPSASNSKTPALATAARRTMTQIHVFSALFGLAMFTNHTTQMLLVNEKEDWHAIRWRASMNVLAFFLSMPLGRVIARTLHLRVSRRILAIGGAAVPIAFV